MRLRRLPKGKVRIGKHIVGMPYIYSYNKNDLITIGTYCSFGPDVVIIPSMAHIPARGYELCALSTFPLPSLNKKGTGKKHNVPMKEAYVKIGSDVWIGAHAIILPAVTVGDGAIVGAGAVVTHDVPPYAVVVGVPAKILRFRFDEDTVNKLLRIRWWDWPEHQIIENLDYFYDVEEFIKRFESPPERETSMIPLDELVTINFNETPVILLSCSWLARAGRRSYSWRFHYAPAA